MRLDRHPIKYLGIRLGTAKILLIVFEIIKPKHMNTHRNMIKFVNSYS